MEKRYICLLENNFSCRSLARVHDLLFILSIFFLLFLFFHKSSSCCCCCCYWTFTTHFLNISQRWNFLLLLFLFSWCGRWTRTFDDNNILFFSWLTISCPLHLHVRKREREREIEREREKSLIHICVHVVVTIACLCLTPECFWYVEGWGQRNNINDWMRCDRRNYIDIKYSALKGIRHTESVKYDQIKARKKTKKKMMMINMNLVWFIFERKMFSFFSLFFLMNILMRKEMKGLGRFSFESIVSDNYSCIFDLLTQTNVFFCLYLCRRQENLFKNDS